MQACIQACMQAGRQAGYYSNRERGQSCSYWKYGPAPVDGPMLPGLGVKLWMQALKPLHLYQ